MTDEQPTPTDQAKPSTSLEKAPETKGMALVHVPQNGRDDRRSDLIVLPEQVGKAPSFSYRTRAERDKDRLLYAGEFRRLAGVTQVVQAWENDIYHNRLTHTLEVAQIGRRLAQHISRQMQADPQLSQYADQVNPDVVEAACLAHDLGHPPFGHVAEGELNRLVVEHGNPEGFEGTAQSFRVVTRLARFGGIPGLGLNLTRASLNAVLKYAWLKQLPHPEGDAYPQKFGAYREDLEAFDFARLGQPEGVPSLEAQIMDHADAIAYVIHDLSDFYKAGILSFTRLKTDARFFESHFERHRDTLLRGEWADKEAEVKAYLQGFILPFYPGGRFRHGARDEVARLEQDAELLGYLVKESLHVSVEGGALRLKPSAHAILAIDFLRTVIKDFVIDRPELALQQLGHTRIIHKLFDLYHDALLHRQYHLLPLRYADEIEQHAFDSLDQAARARLTADIISQLSEKEAVQIYKTVMGEVN